MPPECLRELVSSVLWAVFLVFLIVDGGCLVKDLLDFLTELITRAIGFESGVALDAPAVRGDFSEVCKAGFPAESKDFLEEEFELVLVVFAKVADRAEVWLLVRSEISEVDVPFEKASKLAGASATNAVAEDENLESHHRIVGRPPAAVLPGVWIKRLKL